MAWFALPWLIFPFTTWYFWNKSSSLRHALEAAIMLGSIAGATATNKWLQRKLVASKWRLCPRCGFDMNGLGDKCICPECGRPFDATADAKVWKEFSGPP